MTPSNEFFLIFLCTIFLTRLFLYVKPIQSPTWGGFRLHHYMYGMLAVIIGLWIHSLGLYAIGFGLFVYELTYPIIGGKTHADNYSIRSLLGTTGFILLTFIFREYLVLLMV